MLDNHNKRKFQRIATDCRLSYRSLADGAVHEGRCLNLSGGGLLFKGPAAVEIGYALEVSVLPDNRLTPPLDASSK
ncbi:PilZ domain-containing protein [Methylogaea oryzae]|uniref:PilZ domain-containing protein n=1 Tax=Methylogaea oryzae TaxID=1295382 RepID=UPI0006D02D0B|nr:PilZ domain-containing protein [Methylogaea oryzae]